MLEGAEARLGHAHKAACLRRTEIVWLSDIPCIDDPDRAITMVVGVPIEKNLTVSISFVALQLIEGAWDLSGLKERIPPDMVQFELQHAAVFRAVCGVGHGPQPIDLLQEV